MGLLSRIADNSVDATKAEVQLYNKLIKSRLLAGMTTDEVARLDITSPFIQTVARWPEVEGLAGALLKVGGLRPAEPRSTLEIRAIIGLHGLKRVQPHSSLQTALARRIALRVIEDALMKAIEVLPVPRSTNRARKQHNHDVTAVVARSVRLFAASPDHDHFVDSYYLQAALDNPTTALDDPSNGATTLPGSELVDALVQARPEVIEPFARFRSYAGASSRDVTGLAARVVIDTALANAIDAGPFASQLGPEAGSRADRGLRHLIFVTQRHALEHSLEPQTSVAG